MPKWAIVLIIFLLLSIAAGVRDDTSKVTTSTPTVIERSYDTLEECEADPEMIVCSEE